MRNVSSKIVLGCGTLEPGNGGISSVSRMMLRSLFEEAIPFNVASLLDKSKSQAYGRRVRGAGGNQFMFAAQTHRLSAQCRHMIYDHVGLARAAPKLPGFKRDYSVWIHGVEVLSNLTKRRMDALKNAKCILVNSEFTLRQFEARNFVLSNARVCPLATEVPSCKLNVAKMTSSPTVGILSRITNDGFMKGHLHLIDVWSRILEHVPEARLIIAGEGSGLAELRELVAQSPVSQNIEILGRVEGDALEAFWQRIDVFAMPSRVEGFGIVYAEAMQRGVPVIASVHDAGNEINLDGETGFNVNLDNSNSLAGALIKVLADGGLRKDMACAAHAHWKSNYQFSDFKTRFLAILQNDILA